MWALAAPPSPLGWGTEVWTGCQAPACPTAAVAGCPSTLAGLHEPSHLQRALVLLPSLPTARQEPPCMLNRPAPQQGLRRRGQARLAPARHLDLDGLLLPPLCCALPGLGGHSWCSGQCRASGAKSYYLEAPVRPRGMWSWGGREVRARGTQTEATFPSPLSFSFPSFLPSSPPCTHPSIHSHKVPPAPTLHLPLWNSQDACC